MNWAIALLSLVGMACLAHAMPAHPLNAGIGFTLYAGTLGLGMWGVATS